MAHEWRTPEIEQRLAIRRRRATLVCAGLIALYFGEDLWNGGADTKRLVFCRAGWVAVQLMCAMVMVQASPRVRRLLLGLIGISAGTFTSAITLVHGDHHTTYFAFQLVVPLCVVVVLQDEIGAVLLAVVATLAGAVTILWLSNATPHEFGVWLQALVGSSAIAVYASFHQWSQLREESTQQHRLAQAERLALIGQLAAGVAHEINNPLGFISSNLAFIEEELPPGHDELRAVLGETHQGLKRIKAIVGDLTAFSRGGPEESTLVDLNLIVAEARRLASMRTRDQVEIVNQLRSDLPRVLGNERHLCQVFLNLILNAADALCTASTPGGKIWVHASTEAGALRIDVDDNGPGIPAAVLASLFTPFFTTKKVGQGTGLGLATSREYMRRGGGDLVASARPGGGARFTLTLPLPIA